MASRRDQKPLACRVTNGALVIEIGIETLAHAFLRSDYAFELQGNDRDDPRKRFRIDDKEEFATDVVRELLAEAEDGSSMLTKLVDEACKRAVEEGSIALIDENED